jgi:hypothetical protein
MEIGFHGVMTKQRSWRKNEVQADLHVHSCHSKHPGEWILQRLGAQESYTPVETIYRQAKEQGSAFVTLTDHNTIDGALELCRAHPEDCFVSTEATAYFPEDGCKVHTLCYDISPAQFATIQRARENICNLRDYLRQEDIACSVAHATFSVNNRLTLDHIEKLLVLFDEKSDSPSFCGCASAASETSPFRSRLKAAPSSSRPCQPLGVVGESGCGKSTLARTIL